MKNQTNLTKRIRNIIVGNTLPANEDLWLDTSEGEKKGVLKYKGNPIVGGGGSNSDYNSTKQTVTLFNDTIEQMAEVQGIYVYEVLNPDFGLVVGETYTVIFDGVSYDIEAVEFSANNAVVLGEIGQSGPSFDTYPFMIMEDDDLEEISLIFGTLTEGPHTFVIKHEETVTTTTPEFKDAVDSVTGYSIDKSGETLYDGTIETIDDDGYISGIITPTITFVEGDTYKVTFNGTKYTCKCFNAYSNLSIGATFNEGTPDWSTYPFNIATYNAGGGQNETALTTNQEGSYTLKIEHLSVSTKTTPEFESMIQGIAGGGTFGCQIIYPDEILRSDNIYSIYNKVPEAGNIYFISLIDQGSTNRDYLYPVHIDELINRNGIFSGSATIIGTPIILNNGALTIVDFEGEINSLSASGLQITYTDNTYRLSYKAGEDPLS